MSTLSKDDWSALIASARALLGAKTAEQKADTVRAPVATQEELCRYGVCEPGDYHARGCTEYTFDEIRAAAPKDTL